MASSNQQQNMPSGSERLRYTGNNLPAIQPTGQLVPLTAPHMYLLPYTLPPAPHVLPAAPHIYTPQLGYYPWLGIDYFTGHLVPVLPPVYWPQYAPPTVAGVQPLNTDVNVTVQSVPATSEPSQTVQSLSALSVSAPVPVESQTQILPLPTETEMNAKTGSQREEVNVTVQSVSATSESSQLVQSSSALSVPVPVSAESQTQRFPLPRETEMDATVCMTLQTESQNEEVVIVEKLLVFDNAGTDEDEDFDKEDKPCTSSRVLIPKSYKEVAVNLHNVRYAAKTYSPQETGLIGEKLMHVVMKGMLKKAGRKVNWVNMEGESKKQYDLEAVGEGLETLYIEVKTTWSTKLTDSGFFISDKELNFARKKGSYYAIARVRLLSETHGTLTMLRDPVEMVQSGLLKREHGQLLFVEGEGNYEEFELEFDLKKLT